ncbi:hypothetical protein CY34DRAFT_800489, partial [Suillus luteus UH-Slu-Lm8-n1]
MLQETEKRPRRKEIVNRQYPQATNIDCEKKHIPNEDVAQRNRSWPVDLPNV